MTDISTNQPLKLYLHENTNPILDVLVDQLDDVRAVFDAHDVPYWVDTYAVSIDNEPLSTIVTISRNIDPKTVQAILDQAP